MRARVVRSWSVLPLFAFAALIGACASGGSSPSSSGAARGGRNLITSEELAQVASTTAYEAIQRLRPSWLNSRSGLVGPQVHIDGRPVAGGLQILGNMRSTDVSEMRFRSGRDATTLYGTNYSNGVIEVTSRSR